MRQHLFVKRGGSAYVFTKNTLHNALHTHMKPHTSHHVGFGVQQRISNDEREDRDICLNGEGLRRKKVPLRFKL